MMVALLWLVGTPVLAEEFPTKAPETIQKTFPIGKVRLDGAKCELANVLGELNLADQKLWHSGTLFSIKGPEVKFCWRLSPDLKTVLIQDEDDNNVYIRVIDFNNGQPGY